MIYYNFLLIFFSIPALLVIIRNLLATTYLWQIKEYRLDRFLSHIRFEQRIDRKRIPILIIKSLSLIGVWIYLFHPQYNIYFAFIIIIFSTSIFEADSFIKAIIKKDYQRPAYKSIRNIIILVSNILIIFSVYFVLMLWVDSLLYHTSGTFTKLLEIKPLQDISNVGFTEILPKQIGQIYVTPLATLILILVSVLNITMEFAVHYSVMFLVALTYPLSFFRKRAWIMRARIILKKNPQLKIIGITGSYGKTTTKELLAQVLSKNFNVVKTPHNKNTAVGIAMTIASLIKPDTNIFIAEMGAYRKGEIKEAVSLAHPDIAIVTGIEAQHLSLFGSIEKLVAAKFEIIAGLKLKGTAIFNGDNEYCLQMATKTKQQKMLYFTINDQLKMVSEESSAEQSKADEQHMYEFPHDENIYAKGVNDDQNGISFILMYKGVEHHVRTNIVGVHNVLNLLAVIAASVKLGLSVKEVVKIINATKFEFPYLHTFPAINESTLLDDGYNISFAGFLAGLEYLTSLSGYKKKWVLTAGIIELGAVQDKVYQKIAERLVESADGLITSDPLFAGIVREKMREFKVILIEDAVALGQTYKEYVGKNEIVLLEGNVAERVMKEIRSIK